MQIRIFTIPSADSGALQDEMNAFLAGHRVLEIEQKFFQNENGGYWSFCVRYITGGAPPSAGSGYSGRKVDYREILNDRDFAVFSRLRAIRKELAAADGSPAYVVFTDEELAHIARLPEITERTIQSVQGIGEKKAAKYGKPLVEKYNSQTAAGEEGAKPSGNENAKASEESAKLAAEEETVK
jgi:superfamily II DNA helicase RecQ